MTPLQITRIAVKLGLPATSAVEFTLAITERPKAKKASVRVGWRNFDPKSGCQQCGDGGYKQCGDGGYKPNAFTPTNGSGMRLCLTCHAVYTKSKAHWLPNEQFPHA